MKKVDLLLSNALIVTQDEKRSILPDSSLVISGNRIVAMGPSDQIDAQYDAKKTFDLRGKIVFPGLINTHDHLFQVATKGLGEDMAVQDWVTVVTAPTAAQQTPEDIYTVCLTGCLELIHSGVTSVIDMNYMAYTFGLHDENIHALVDSGLRSIYTSIISDYGLQYGIPDYLMRPTDWFIDQYEQLIAKYPPTDRLAVWVAIGAPWTVSGEGLDKALAFSKRTGTPMVMHIGENWVDNHCSLDRFGMNSVPYLEKIGFLRPELLAIHCVTLDDEDIELFRKYNVKVSYNPVSNMYLGNGIPQMMKMQAAGLRIGLGVDGAGSNNSQDMIETMKVAALLQKVAAKDASVVNAQQILDWATLGGAKILGLEDQIGSLEVGKQADLFVIAANSAKVVPIHDPVATLVYSCGQENIEMTIANGVILMQDGVIQHLDEPEILRKCQEMSLALADRCGSNSKVKRSWKGNQA
jgi:5-methylthioadenosine/S-adenosylhomocysteine deaminase